MPPAGLEPTNLTDERPQTCALDHATTAPGRKLYTVSMSCKMCSEGNFVIELVATGRA